MKNLTFTLLLGWLLLFTTNLFAQNAEGRFNLKEGDWFEVQVEQKNKPTDLSKAFATKDLLGATVLLKYQLEKELPNKNQLYNIQLERYRFITKLEENVQGYDSYYPPFDENKTSPDIKNQFSLEVTSTGEIVRFTSAKNNKSRILNLPDYISIQESNNLATHKKAISDSLLIKYFSEILMKPILSPKYKNSDKIIGIKYIQINDKDSIGIEVPYLLQSRVPIFIKFPNLEFYLTNASFPLTDNAIIHGKIKDKINQDIIVSMIGVNREYYFPDKHFRTSNDGSFNCPIFIMQPTLLSFRIGNNEVSTFINPGDTLEIMKLGSIREFYFENGQVRTRKYNFFDTKLKKEDYFSGTVAYNTMLSNEIDQFKNDLSYSDPAIKDEKTANIIFSNIIEQYKGKASTECIDYFERDFMYYVWNIKLREYRRIFFDENRKITEETLSDLTKADSILQIINPFECNFEYTSFITNFQRLRSMILGISNGSVQQYHLLPATLSNFPLYQQLALNIRESLIREIPRTKSTESLYQNYINNCSNPALIEPLKDVYEKVSLLEIGKEFPLDGIIKSDNTIFNLEKYKGKPICLIFLFGSKSYINDYKETIDQFKNSKVHFIIARHNVKYSNDGDADQDILQRPNVTYIEFSDQILKTLLCDSHTRVFTLDKWLRIVDNDAGNLIKNWWMMNQKRKLTEPINNAIKAKRFSKAQKIAFFKTAGWSLGSILFTFLIGLWVYKIRVRKLKMQEAAKRRIKELEIKAVRSQMNPHFVFNALNSIQSLINGNQFKEANIYLSKFAVLLRGVLNNSEKPMVTLSDELQAVELYCQLEQLRFEFKFEIHIDPLVDADIIEIPGMIIQPLVENAIVHGLSPKGNEGELTIRIEKQNGNLCVCVTDNGVGLDSLKVDELSQKGFGLKLVEERINILYLDGKEASLIVENRSDATGTVATLIIPID